ncbi:MAG TPA: HEAT repeat domain-containing protein [Ignavibacteriaceae bacterium]|nr:HEAT repeat domain-containing protein [Ignavibacteriaceae bacterium]
MKKTLTTLVLTLALTLTLGYMNVLGQNTDRLHKNGIPNLKQAVQSENTGLKKSAIYMAGKYKIAEMVEPLVNQLAKEDDDNVKVLIALSLYEIGDEKGIDAIQDLAYRENPGRVKRMTEALVYEYYKDEDNLTALAK